MYLALTYPVPTNLGGLFWGRKYCICHCDPSCYISSQWSYSFAGMVWPLQRDGCIGNHSSLCSWTRLFLLTFSLSDWMLYSASTLLRKSKKRAGERCQVRCPSQQRNWVCFVVWFCCHHHRQGAGRVLTASVLLPVLGSCHRSCSQCSHPFVQDKHTGYGHSLLKVWCFKVGSCCHFLPGSKVQLSGLNMELVASIFWANVPVSLNLMLQHQLQRDAEGNLGGKK